jgi:membrane protein
MGAAMAFYALVSLPPAIAITLQLAGFTLDPTTVRDALMSQIKMVWGADAAATTTAIAHYATSSHANNWGTSLAVIMSIITASTLFVEMRRSLDVIWGEGSDGAIRGFLKSRLVAFGALIVLGVALWASVLVSALLSTADSRYLGFLGISAWTIAMIGNGIAGGVILILLVLLYKLLPQQYVTWTDAWYELGREFRIPTVIV